MPNKHNITESKIQYSLIPFNGEKIMVISQDNKKFVVPKQICENLGLSWSGQFEKIKRDSVLKDAVRMVRIPQKNPSGSGSIDQDTLALPLEYLNGWLFGIDDTRVKKEIRQKVIDYKKQCYIVLYEYFNKGASIDIDRLENDIELQLKQNGYKILFDYSKDKVDRRTANSKAKEIWKQNKTLLKDDIKNLTTPDSPSN
jgi:hypothetical protein